MSEMSELDPLQERPANRTHPERGRMLPGIAGIALFMLVFTLANVFGALSNVFGTGRGKYGALALCTMLAVGIFGLLRMRRWGWAMVMAGAILLFAGDTFYFTQTHAPQFLIRGLFELVFFLYLVRPDVRDRMV
jgi:hypothetical protein